MLPAREERIDGLRAASGYLRRHRNLDEVVAGPLRRGLRALADVPGLDGSARVRALLFAGGHAVAPIDRESRASSPPLRAAPTPGRPRSGA